MFPEDNEDLNMEDINVSEEYEQDYQVELQELLHEIRGGDQRQHVVSNNTEKKSDSKKDDDDLGKNAMDSTLIS